MKGVQWKQYKPLVECSWYWRRICSIKDKVKDGYKGNDWQKGGGKYTIQEGYKWMKGEMEDWPWARWIWSNVNIPKHSIICWLAVRQRLLTRERLEKVGVCTETRCEICGESKETIQHLFFECKFSNECLKLLLKWLGKGIQEPDIENVWKKLTRNVKGKMSRKFITATISALIYKIRMVRNKAVWNNKVMHPELICKQIKQECKIKLKMQNIRKEGRNSRNWLEQLYVTD